MTYEDPGSPVTKPRVLIADDSRIVRAALIKRIEDLFDFREAVDGEEAWQILLLDPSIRVVITDLTMPRLDGYGLLERVRGSRIRRIRELPVVVVSGSDEREERERALAAGATELITKGIATPQLLMRLEALSRLVATQREYERELEELVRSRNAEPVALPGTRAWQIQSADLLESATRSGRNFVVLTLRLGLRHRALEAFASSPPALVVNAVGQLLRRSVRQTDVVAATAPDEFTVAGTSLNRDTARAFAQRICHAITRAHLVDDENLWFVASCGMAAQGDDGQERSGDLQGLYRRAHKRALLGIHLGLSAVIGAEEEAAYERGEGEAGAVAPTSPSASRGEPDLVTLLEWMKDGRGHDVLPHLERLSNELQPLVELMRRQMLV